MRIVIGSDHAGFILKGMVVQYLHHQGHDVTDVGTHSEVSVDYPPICADVARRVVRGEGSGDVSGARSVGIVIGGSGQGEAIAANKVHGARAALCHDEYTARLARRHNDANVLSLGARVVATELALDIVDVFVDTGFDGGRHVVRIDELAAIEEEEVHRPSGGPPENRPSGGGREGRSHR
ncbi:MAG: ribose 5-phosphate isomerase B [Acidimicrobiales bacterium]